ncbi:MAG: PRC-barrel domain-containing protein [Kineosporiaceae bacterium]|nr:PRC-barrel domain-containing protein [Aeromicrobium sp.]
MSSFISADTLFGAPVHASDDRLIGVIGQVYVDDTTETPVWVTVKTGIFGSSETFIPVTAATFDGGIVRVPYSREFVKHAPRIDPDTTLITAQEDSLYRYYDPHADDDRTNVHPLEKVKPFTESHHSGASAPVVTSPPADALLVGAGSGGSGRALLRRHIVTGTEHTAIDSPFDSDASHRSSPLTGP